MTEKEYQIAMAELMRIETELFKLETTHKRLDQLLDDMFKRLEMERPSNVENIEKA